MNRIDLQSKTFPKVGTIEIYWFENEFIGLKRSLFHRMYIPLEPFNSGLDYEEQPVKTKIVFEWLRLELSEPTLLDGVNFTSTPRDETEVSIYIGNAHNPCDIKKFELRKVGHELYQANCEMIIDFQYEGIGAKEEFVFSTNLKLDTEVKNY